ncbi:MAG: hypothetical protein FWD79_04420 [Desulfobulbus sp.]|nr:hypothetical protein [Desulfobulbus sp.]
MTYKVDIVEIDRIYLDNNNPRHDPIDSEPEIITHLLQEESVKQLARHIASIGSTSPLERIGVISHPSTPGAYVSLEGNRRLCALKLLADPDKADSENNKKYFRELAAKLGDISTIEVVIFSSLKTARPWIALRHEGEQDGIGTRRWNPQQKARFNADGGSPRNPNIQATRLIDYARRHNLLPEEELNKVSVTTITRFLSNPVFRDALGLQDNRTLTITVPQEEFDSTIIRFLTDALTPNSGVNSRTNSDDRKSYAEKLRSEGVTPETRGGEPNDLDAPPKSDSPPPEKRAPLKRNNKSPDDRNMLFPGSFMLELPTIS